MKRLPACLFLVLLFGCDAGQSGTSGIAGYREFGALTCDRGASPDLAVARIERMADRGELYVASQLLDDGLNGTVVEVARGDFPRSGIHVLMIYPEGVKTVAVSARMKSAPEEVDRQFVSDLLDAVRLQGCVPATANVS